MSHDENKYGNIFYVYALIDPENRIPFYIGKGCNDRMHDHEKDVLKGKIPNNNKHLFYKIRKILDSGKPIIYEKLLENVDEDSAFIDESDRILKIGRANIKTGPLCNLTNGGDGASGLICTEAMRYNKSKAVSGDKNPMFGKHHSNSAKEIISKKRLQRTWKYHHTEAHKAKLRLDNPGGKATAKRIYQIDLNGNVIREWSSIRNAAKELNLNFSNISTCTRMKNRRAGQCFWRFIDDVNIQNGKLIGVELLKVDSRKKLKQMDTFGNVIKVWESITNACNELKMVPSMITWASKYNKPHKNFYWKIE